MEIKKEINKIKKKLKAHEERLYKLEERVSRFPPDQAGIKGFEKLAGKIDIEKEEIWECFDLEDTILTVINTIGEDDKEKTQNISLLCLLGYKYFFGKNDLLSKEIRRNVAENDIPLNNFATYLKEIMPTLIRRKGKPKSTKITYRLTTLGEARAQKLLKNLCEG